MATKTRRGGRVVEQHPDARRITYRRDSAGEWRYKVQGYNWRTIDASEEGFNRLSYAQRRARRRYPGVEEVIID